MSSGCGLVLDLDEPDDAGTNPRFDASRPDAGVADGAAPACMSSIECDDDNACDGLEECVDGACFEGTPPDCDDEIACTVDTCDSVSGTCMHAATDSLCTSTAACADARCDDLTGCYEELHHERCDDTIVCTIDSCDPLEGGANGCLHEADHTRCAGDPGVCDVNTGCATETCGTDAECPAIQCTTVACVGGVCMRDRVADDLPCDDGNPCTHGDSCTLGECRGVESLRCPGQQCVICNPLEGGCDGTLFAPDTVACSDGSLCTIGDRCDGAGSCMSGSPSCVDTTCSTSLCDAATGQCSNTPRTCQPDNNPCTSDMCQNVGGCTYPHADGLLCTNATGAAGMCVGGICTVSTCSGGAPRCPNGDCCASPGFCALDGTCVTCQADQRQCRCDLALPCHPLGVACECADDPCAAAGILCNSTSERCCDCPTGPECQSSTMTSCTCGVP